MRRRDFIKVVAGSGAGVALYFAYPNRVQLVAGEGRSYLLSLNAPAGQRWIGPFKNRLRELIAGVIALRKTGGQQQ
jgi:hypothetical protein